MNGENLIKKVKKYQAPSMHNPYIWKKRKLLLPLLQLHPQREIYTLRLFLGDGTMKFMVDLYDIQYDFIRTVNSPWSWLFFFLLFLELPHGHDLMVILLGKNVDPNKYLSQIQIHTPSRPSLSSFGFHDLPLIHCYPCLENPPCY